MSDFDDRLRAALNGGAEQAPDAGRLAAGARRRLRVRRRRLAVAGAAAAVVAVVTPTVVLSGTGEDRPPPVGDPDVPPELRVTCGGDVSWPVAAMDGGLEDEVVDAEVRDAFARLLAEAPLDAPEAIRAQGPDAAPYVVLAAGEDEVTLGVGDWSLDGPGEGAETLGLERDGDRLRASGWGDCTLAVAVPERRSRVEVRAPRGGVDPGATRVVVEVEEVACTGGRNPLPHLDEPVVVEGEDRVLVSLTSEAVVGDATCQGNPSVPLTIELDEPLGDRRLYDAGTWPPTPVETSDGEPVPGWTTQDLGWMTFELPPGWVPLDCEEGWVRYGTPGGCEEETGVWVLESDATFDPSRGPGIWPAEESAGGSWKGWAGYVHVGDGVIDVQGVERAAALRILGSARSATDAPLDVSAGWETVTRNGVTFDVPVGWEPPYGVEALSNRVLSSRFPLDEASARRHQGRWVLSGDVDGADRRVVISAPSEATAELVADSARVDRDPGIR